MSENKVIMAGNFKGLDWDIYDWKHFPAYMHQGGSVFILKNSLHYLSTYETNKYRKSSGDGMALVFVAFSLRDLLRSEQ